MRNTQKGSVLIWVIVVVIILVGIGFYFYSKNNSVTSFQATPNNLNWKQYKNTKYGFEIEYPPQAKLEEINLFINILSTTTPSGINHSLIVLPNNFDQQSLYAMDIYVTNGAHYKYDFRTETWSHYPSQTSGTADRTYSWDDFIQLQDSVKHTSSKKTQSGLPIFVFKKIGYDKEIHYHFVVIDRDRSLGVVFTHHQRILNYPFSDSKQWDKEILEYNEVMENIVASFRLAK